jgi:outer membrane receptor protein involved in Fe transport
MSNHVALSRAVRIALFAAAGATTSFHMSVAFAQEATPTDASPEPQTVVVTGSRIARPELEAPAPILSLGAEQLQSQGLKNFADIAAQTPQFAASFGTSRTQSTFSGAASSGLNLVNLRNLGEQRTLTLINGRRVPSGTTTSTGVDFNTLPTANIDRVEISTGGASAVYGADAVAGTINIITKRIEGVEFGASYSASEEGDNKNPGGYLMMGGNFNDRGYGSLTVQYEDQGIVKCADRYLCAEDVFWSTPDNFQRGPAVYSAVGANAKFQLGTSGAFYTSRNGSFTNANGSLIPFVTSIDGYNRNAVRTLAIPTKRLMIQAEGDYELGLGVTAFTELNFGSSKTEAPFEGNPFQSTGAGNLFGSSPTQLGLQASIPVNNPFIPQALRAALPATATVMNWQQRFNQMGDRGAENERTTVRAMAGFRGGFASPLPVGGDWNWEVSHVFGRTDLDSITDGLVGTDRLYYSLRVESDGAGGYRCADAGARATGCVPVNPFAPYTQAMKDYLNVRAGQSGRSEIEDTTAFISGSIFALPAGEVKAVVGAERRSFAGFLDYDEVINRALVTGNQIGDIDRVKTVTRELFTELSVPILKDVKFAEELQFNGSYRTSNPDRGDDYETWGAGLVWEPLSGVRLRVNQARAVRTPTPGDLSGRSQTFGTVDDPCAGLTAANAGSVLGQNCLAAGVPLGYVVPQQTAQSVSGFVTGNPDLDPERANTTTIGVVFTPRLIEGFSFSIDHFKIDLKDAISEVGRQNRADLCYNTVERLYCDSVTRGATPTVPGGYALTAVDDATLNLGRYVIGGYDIETTYRFDLSRFITGDRDFGAISLRAAMTIYDQADQVTLPGEPLTDLLGFAGGSTTDQGWIKRQGVLDTTYKLGRISANWHMRYVGSTNMAQFLDPEFRKIGTYLYHDLRFGFEFKKNSEAYLGVTNLADKDPPFFASSASGTQALDTIPAYYDVFGRSFFAGARVRF